jgi:signal transduction histidine kinase
MSPLIRTSLSRYWPMLSVLTVGLTVSAWLGWSEHRAARRTDEKIFELEAMQAAAALEMSMERHEERLGRLADHGAQFEELPLMVWRFRHHSIMDFATQLPAVMLALHCPKIGAGEFGAHHERAKTMWPPPNAYTFDPKPGGRRYALPVWQRWNRTEIDPIPLGADLGRAGDRWPSFEPALEKGNAWAGSQPSTVRRVDGTATAGFWFALPIYAVDQPGPKSQRQGESTPQFLERLKAHRVSVTKGLLVAFISTDRLIDETYNAASRPSRLHARLYTQREPAPEALLNPASRPPANPVFRRTIVMPWYGQRWCLELVSTPLFEAEATGRRAWWIGGSGTGLTLLAAAMIGLTVRARVRQERLTGEITEARNTLAATERARESMGDDLHDGAIQSLYAIQLGLTRTARDVADALPSAARVLDETRTRVDVVIAELRRLIVSATQRRPSDEAPSLEHVLASVVQSLRPTTSADIVLDASPGSGARLSPAQSVALAQLARSALGNALRHSEAKRVSVHLAQSEKDVTLVVSDDGKGFTVAERETAGLGITTMRRRATDAGGELTIESTPGRGTRVAVRLGLLGADSTSDIAAGEPGRKRSQP